MTLPIRAVFPLVISLALLAGAAASAAADDGAGWLERIGERPYQAAPGCPETPSAMVRPAGQPPPAARYAVCADQVELLRAAIKSSAERRRLLLVVLGASWCPWCGALQRQLEQGEIARHARGLDFDVLDLALSTTSKGAMVAVPSGLAAREALIGRELSQRRWSYPAVVLIDPRGPRRLVARNIDDFAREKEGRYDAMRLGAMLVAAKAHVETGTAAPTEPGPIMRRLQRWWYR